MVIFYYCVKLFGDIARFIYFSKIKKNKEDKNDALKMIQCEKCKTYIPKSEARLENGKTICQKDHEI